MPLLVTMMLLVSSHAHAEECDVEALSAAVEEASPTKVASVYVELAGCDAEAARDFTEAAFGRMLASEDAYRATVSALGLEQEQPVRGWLEGLEPGFKSSAIEYLGEHCKEDPAVASFFVDAHSELGETFWMERWHRGLADCRTEAIQGLLADEVAASTEGGRIADNRRFFALLEIYARNLGGDAVPTLSRLADEVEDDEAEAYVINAFADAAQVGSETGMNPAIAAASVQSIVELAPELSERAILQARTTLVALGAEKEADSLAKHRWPERFDGAYEYGAVATEIVSCRNGKQQGYFHFAPFREPGRLWPEQIELLLEEKLSFEWELDAAERCRGEGTTKVVMPSEPFPDEKSATAWFEEQRKSFDALTAGFKKSVGVKHQPFEM